MNINSFNGIVIDDEQRFEETVSFESVQINGAAEFIEQAEAGQLEIAGYAIFRNFTTCDRLTVSGKADFRKRLLAESVRNTGECVVYGRLHCDVLVDTGSMRLRSPSSLGRVVVKEDADLRATGKLKVDRMTVNGTISVVGGIKGEIIEINSPADSSADYIYAEELSVRRKSDRKYVLSATEVDVIDADVEYTYIDQLSCDNANIGPGCYIRELMYRDKISVSSESFVERLIKV